MSDPVLLLRRAEERFRTAGGGIDSRHVFSFGAHYDPDRVGTGPLLVLNDETLLAGRGFDDHPHADAEIVTWVLSGSLAHTDSSGHAGVVVPGLAQRMSAGSGIVHAERNDAFRADPRLPVAPVHFVQMWLRPDVPGTQPGYDQRAVDLSDLAQGLATGRVGRAPGRGGLAGQRRVDALGERAAARGAPRAADGTAGAPLRGAGDGRRRAGRAAGQRRLPGGGRGGRPGRHRPGRGGAAALDDAAVSAPQDPAAELPLLIRVYGQDRPGVTSDLLRLLGDAGAALEDMEQLVVRERLTLDVLVRLDGADDSLLRDILYWGFTRDLRIEFERVAARSRRAQLVRHAVTVLGRPLPATAVAAVADAISGTGGNIDRIVRLATTPVTAYDFVVIAGDVEAMRRVLVEVARDHGIDVAVQVNGLERRAKRLVVMDVDSTLIVDEVIELLADEAGQRAEVAAITARAMAGELDFEGSLRERVRLLAGLDEAAVARVRDRIRLTPGARTFVRTLKRLGFTVAIVSGGFTPFTDWLRADLGLDYAYANGLAVVDGVLTGEVEGPVVDRAGKARLLARIAAAEGVPLSQTVAVGDGANDLDMLAAAGLGIAFNAKPVVRAQADTTVSVPYLDAILFMLGIRGSDVDRGGEEGGDGGG